MAAMDGSSLGLSVEAVDVPLDLSSAYLEDALGVDLQSGMLYVRASVKGGLVGGYRGGW